MVMEDTRMQVTRLMVDSVKSGTLSADLTINMSSRSSVAIGRLLPSRRWNLPLSTHSCHHHLMASSLDPYDKRFSDFANLPFSIENDMTSFKL
ncbi:hypothetical protein TNCV_4874961 [Trichonephila clavipes]|nr:hypothetical protein TNCV_4874961 [Trichonephila clavipes]